MYLSTNAFAVRREADAFKSGLDCTLSSVAILAVLSLQYNSW